MPVLHEAPSWVGAWTVQGPVTRSGAPPFLCYLRPLRPQGPRVRLCPPPHCKRRWCVGPQRPVAVQAAWGGVGGAGRAWQAGRRAHVAPF